MLEAVQCDGGRWELRDCAILSSKRSRACTSVNIRNAAQLTMLNCTIQNCISAVCLDRMTASLHMEDCTVASVREAIVTTRRGGGLVLQRNTFEGVKTVLKLDEKVSGRAVGNTMDGSLFGPFLRPPGFECSENTHASESEESAGEAEGDP